MITDFAGKHVLVTGGTGFIGQEFVRQLSEQHAIVYATTRTKPENCVEGCTYIVVDLTNPQSCTVLPTNVDLVIHCAAIDGNAEFKRTHAATIFFSNVAMATHVVSYAREQHIKDVVMLSSSEVYIENSDSPLSESTEYALATSKYQSYRLSKIISELIAVQLLRTTSRLYIPRLANVFGPHDSLEAQKIRFIPKLIVDILEGNDVEIWGDGSAKRNFIFVTDAVSATLTIVASKITGPINIASPTPVTLSELVAKISSILQQSPLIAHMTSRSTISRVLSTNLIEKYFTSFTPLEFGLSSTIGWIRHETKK